MIRLDDLGINDMKIYQDTDGFCFGTDSVLLSWFSSEKLSNKICDLCTGTGIIPLLLSAKFKDAHITGAELSRSQSKLAQKSVEYNGLNSRIDIINCDIRKINLFLQKAEFDLVTVNPPYMKNGHGFISEGEKIQARAETECDLDDVVNCADYLLKQGGRLCIVHRAERLTDVICTMRGKNIEPKRLITVQSKADNKPYIILCEGKKGAKPGSVIEKPLVIYTKDGKHTNILKQIYSRSNMFYT